MNININRYGQGIPLVLFHGWGFDSQIWLPLIPFLENNYQLILVDLPGFGFTSMMDWQAFKVYLLEQLPPQFALAGWSMGGLYATRLAIEEPGRVRCLLNINSSPRFITDTLWPGVAKELFVNFYKNLSTDLNKTLNEFVALQLNKNKFKFVPLSPPSPKGLESGLNILDTWDLRDGLKSITQPACFMFGRLDPITPVNLMNTMQLFYPNFKYVLFNKAAHMPFLSHSELFVTEILEFIQ